MTDLSKLESGGVESPVPATDPLMIAWEAYKQSPAYANSRKWAQQEEHVDGSMWAAFMTGFTYARDQERQRTLAIISAARFGEIDGDLRSIRHRIQSGESLPEKS